MTAEEAYRLRKDNPEDVLDNPNIYSELSDVIDDALMKQIPKKPYRHESSPSDIYLCSVCGSTFVVRDRIHMNYCGNCGQRVKFDRGE